MELITSVRNPRIREAVKLRDRKARKRSGCTIVDGVREVSCAAAAGAELVELFVCPALLDRRQQEALARLASRTALFEVTEEVFGKLAFGQRAEGLVAVVRPQQRPLREFSPPERALVVVLESLEKPGNLGAIVRSADGAGVSAVIASGGGTDLYNPSAIRASLGTVFAIPVFAAGSEETLDFLRSQQMAIYAARVEAECLYTEVDWRKPSAIVVGSEAAGLTACWDVPDVVPIALPMRGNADSLNVSAAAAVLFYEALRQRSAAKSGE